MNKKFIISILVIFILLSNTTIILSKTNTKNIQLNNQQEKGFGFIIDVKDDQSYEMQILISRLVNKILNEKITVYWLSEDITVLSDDLKIENNLLVRIFEKGCFIVPFEENFNIIKSTFILIDSNITNNIPIFQLKESLINIEVYNLNEPMIGYMDRNTVEPFNYYQSLVKGGFSNHKFFSSEEIINSNLKDEINVLIHGGSGPSVNIFEEFIEIINPLTKKAYPKIKEFVNNGGGYVGSCYGAHVASNKVNRPIQIPIDLSMGKFTNLLFGKKLHMGLIDRDVYRALPGGSGMAFSNSSGITIRIVDKDNPVGFGLPELIKGSKYFGGPAFLGKESEGSTTKDLGLIEDIGDEDKYSWSQRMEACPIFNSKIVPENIKKARLDKWVNYSLGKPIWVTSKYGEGKVAVFGDHPEFFGTLSPPRLIYNAVLFSCSDGPYFIDIDSNRNFIFDNVSSNGPYCVNISEIIDLKASFNKTLSEDHSYYWYLEDFVIKEGKNISYHYDEYNEYPIILILQNNGSDLFIDVSSVKILGNIDVTINQYSVFLGESIEFNAEVVGGFKPYNYYWDFDDGTNSTEIDPIHSFSDVAIYNCKLKIKDFYNNTKMSNFSVIANNNTSNFSASFKNNVEERVNIGKEIIFSINFSKTNNYTVNISFDDSSFFQTESFKGGEIFFNHSFSKPGIFYPKATIIDNFGEKIIVDTEIYVNSPPNIMEKPEGKNITPTARRYFFNYTPSDPDNDRLRIIMKFDYGDFNSTYNLSKIFMYESGEKGIMYCYPFVEASYNLSIKAVDEYGAVSTEWSEPLSFKIIKSQTLWKTPYLAAIRLVRKYPGEFPILEEIIDLI